MRFPAFPKADRVPFTMRRESVVLRRARRSVLAIGLAAVGVASAGATSLSLAPSLSTVDPGRRLTIDVLIDDVVSLYGFQFSLAYDPAVLQLIAVAEGPALGSVSGTFFVPGSIDNTLGRLGLTLGTLTGPVDGFSGSGRLASVSFSALAGGRSAVTLGDALLVSSSGDLIDAGTAGATVTVLTPVPEPSSALLLALGLVAAAGWRGRIAMRARA